MSGITNFGPKMNQLIFKYVFVLIRSLGYMKLRGLLFVLASRSFQNPPGLPKTLEKAILSETTFRKIRKKNNDYERLFPSERNQGHMISGGVPGEYFDMPNPNLRSKSINLFAQRPKTGKQHF